MKNPKTNSKVRILIITLVVIGILWIIWINFMNSKEFMFKKNETSAWKTYSNSEVDFTFKYPLNWEVKEEYQYKSAACQMNSECKGVHYILLNRIDYTRQTKMGEKDKHGIAINMPQCTGIKWSNLRGNNWICVFDENPEVLNIYEEIKESFQLIDNETTNWNVYRNETYGFEVKYPKNWSISVNGCSDDFMEIEFDASAGCVTIGYRIIPQCTVRIVPVNKEEYNRCIFSNITKTKKLLGGAEAVLYPGGPGKGPFYCVERNNQHFIIYETSVYVSPHRNPNAPPPPYCPKDSTKIISTFRFLE